MQLAIVHYHFDPGGVTQVVLNHLAALTIDAGDIERVILLCGPRQSALPDSFERFAPLRVDVVTVEALEYGEGDQLTSQLLATLSSVGCPPESTLLHLHNHSLGKNLGMMTAVSQLAGSGYRLLLQVHDFAEDFRPANYAMMLAAIQGNQRALGNLLYPQAPQIHYAVLNRRDGIILAEAGVSAERLHWLPNPVTRPVELSDRATARKLLQQHCSVGLHDHLVIYPVRGIRRKNLGEALLWSTLLPDNTVVGFTLPPANPIERTAYDDWARQENLPVRFGMGTHQGVTYADIISGSDQMLTTSVAEGFGMVFLETWLFDRTLIGRDLSEITYDFRQAGVEFPGLRSSLEVPVGRAGGHRYRSALEALYRHTLEQFKLPFDAGQFSSQMAQRLDGPSIDFAHLTIEEQGNVVSLAKGDSQLREALLELNPHIGSATNIENQLETVCRNKEIVEARFSLGASGQNLRTIYAKCIGSHASDSIEPLPQSSAVLEAFLSLDRFTPVRVE